MKLEKKNIKHIVCYSGGHSSAIVAIEVVRKYGVKNVILLNHNINRRYENEDIKRFKNQVSNYLKINVTYANRLNELDDNLIQDQFQVVEELGTFVNPSTRQALCTTKLKTEPFNDYLKSLEDEFVCAYYGFDEDELNRVERRKTILNDKGIDSDFPIALWGENKYKNLQNYLINNKKSLDILYLEGFKNRDNFKRTIYSTKEIGIEPPNTYSIWKHANCIGCLKAGQQHWYCVYVHDYETFERAKLSEKIIGFSIIKGEFLKDLEPKFKKMMKKGIPANEHIPFQKFWSQANKYLKEKTMDMFPCECWI